MRMFDEVKHETKKKRLVSHKNVMFWTSTGGLWEKFEINPSKIILIETKDERKEVPDIQEEKQEQDNTPSWCSIL